MTKTTTTTTTTPIKRGERIAARNQTIREEYYRLRNLRHLGKAIYNHGYIVAQLEAKYFLSTKTIESIVWS